MRILFSVLFSIASIVSFSQITINESDFGSAADTFRFSNVVIDTIDYQTTGANITWDYSFLDFDSQTIDSLLNVDDSPVSYRLFFNNPFLYPRHSSSYSMQDGDIDLGGFFSMTNVFNYYKLDQNALRFTGFGAMVNGAPLPIQYDSIEYLYQFPINYGGIDSSEFLFSASIPSLGHYGGSGKRINTVDGWGSITTPYGTFDALRIKTEIDRQDTIHVDLLNFGLNIPVRRNEYKWFTKNEGVPILQINTLFLLGEENVQNIIYRDSARKSYIGIEELLPAERSFTTYPNPTSNFITIKATGSNLLELVELYSITGQLVKKISPSGKSQITINTESLQAGYYFIILQSNNKRFYTKITVID